LDSSQICITAFFAAIMFSVPTSKICTRLGGCPARDAAMTAFITSG
jgi:hypothetical protein